MLQMQNLTVLLTAGLLCLQCLPLLCTADPTGTRCPPVKGRESETCVCNKKNGYMIDLSSLGRRHGSPRFTNLPDANGWLYSYNPCKPYRSSPCDGSVHVCQTVQDQPDLTFTIADAGTEEMWLDTDGTPYLYYTGPEFYPGSGIRETKVYFHCDKRAKRPRATTVGDSQKVQHYRFDITTIKACQVKVWPPDVASEQTLTQD